jgi:hypothetical protein
LSRPLNRFGRAVESIDWNAKVLTAMLAYRIELDMSFPPTRPLRMNAKRSRRKVRGGSIGSSNGWRVIW